MDTSIDTYRSCSKRKCGVFVSKSRKAEVRKGRKGGRKGNSRKVKERFMKKVFSMLTCPYDCFGKSNLCYLHAYNGIASECQFWRGCHAEYQRRRKEEKRNRMVKNLP